MKLKNILKNNATLIITIFLALTIAILSAKFMLSSNEDYLSIINNLTYMISTIYITCKNNISKQIPNNIIITFIT